MAARACTSSPGPADLDQAVATARREAASAFGDDTLIVEPYIEAGRHVEVQVFGDEHGNVVHLFDRDCSAQRRHQKVVEEAPAPFVPDAVRTRIHEASVALCREVGYTNAGTVEFLVKGDEAFFLEMNTRLQVEHPVTEEVTGLDLVLWQLDVAAGRPLPRTQDEITLRRATPSRRGSTPRTRTPASSRSPAPSRSSSGRPTPASTRRSTAGARSRPRTTR